MYNVSLNKDFQDGTKSREQIVVEFLDNFEGAKGNRDGTVTLQEFVDYYTDLSSSITSDDMFIAILESAWCIAEDEDASVFKEQIEQLTQTIRAKLRVLSNKSTDEFVLRNIFKDFDTNKSGTLTVDELTAMVAKLQISVDRKFMTALFKRFDTNCNGIIEFEEFSNYLINDPYK